MSALLEPTVRVHIDCPTCPSTSALMLDVPAGPTEFQCLDCDHRWPGDIAEPDVCDQAVGGGLWCGLEPGHDDGCAAVIS